MGYRFKQNSQQKYLKWPRNTYMFNILIQGNANPLSLLKLNFLHNTYAEYHEIILLIF